jgi:putative SOS response-associated peptidase YedK
MPVIVAPEAADQWLSGNDVAQLLRAYPAEEMEAYRVSRALFAKGSQGPVLIEPAADVPELRKVVG